MRLPEWIKTGKVIGDHKTKKVLRSHGVSTVCEEARCPNKGHCFSKPTATFMILGDSCTRNCGFCSVNSSRPALPDPLEPEKIALASKEMGLRYVVITSVTRDDLPDGGAGQFAETITMVRRYLPKARIEVLTPDFFGNRDAVKTVLKARPDVFNHNIETVPRLYSQVRPQAVYRRSLEVLKAAQETAPSIPTKSGLMVGLGESFDEVISVMRDLRSVGCRILTIGQYLRPGRENLPVTEYVRPEVFDRYREVALELGFSFVASAPLVRSSMNAEEMYSAREDGADPTPELPC
ncbi:MAG: lipoyl synthase [Nitrospirota bacterium]|nr:lipoyl synthase [Nitrospirota bacterium]